MRTTGDPEEPPVLGPCPPPRPGRFSRLGPQGVLKAAQVIQMGGQSGKPLGWIIIWGTTSNKMKIRILAGFVAGILSLLEQEVEPCRGWECSLERNWFPANGEEIACFSTVIPSHSMWVYGASQVQAVETQPVVHKIDRASWS